MTAHTAPAPGPRARLGHALLLALLVVSLSGPPLAARADDESSSGWQILVGDQPADERFSLPSAAAVDGQGDLYVLDAGNARVQKLSPDGDLLAQWGSDGSGPGQFAKGKGLRAF